MSNRHQRWTAGTANGQEVPTMPETQVVVPYEGLKDLGNVAGLTALSQGKQAQED
jgi:hypothetical protein